MALFCRYKAPETLWRNKNMQKQTTMIKPSEINRKWYVIDATDVLLGRLGTLVC